MNYKNIYKASFIKRVNRFIAHVMIDGNEEIVHVKNTGRCKELFIEGTTVFLEKSDNPHRKTKYSLVSLYKGNELINIDSQVPNQVVFEAIQSGQILNLNTTFLKREQSYGNSRFDIYYETAEAKGYIEVKGVTLEENGLAKFPDAPTSRGTKHVLELIEGAKEGFKNYIVLLVQLKNVTHFVPNHLTDPKFAEALLAAEKAGVNIHVFTSIVTEEGISIDQEISYDLNKKNSSH